MYKVSKKNEAVAPLKQQATASFLLERPVGCPFVVRIYLPDILVLKRVMLDLANMKTEIK